MKLPAKKIIIVSLFGAILASCSSMKTTTDKRDPFEDYNRNMYSFNDSAYEFMKPAAKGYDNVVPKGVQTSIFNIYQNLLEPARIVNDLFQAKLGYAGDDSIRFLTNTTFGILGIFDVADDWFGKEKRYHQSFAVSLHKWGVYDDGEASPYVVWPLLGPGTLEDLSTGVDALFNPLTYVVVFTPGIGLVTGAMISWGSYGAYQVNQGVSYLPTYSNLKEVSIDPYLALRNAYLQSYDYGIAKILERDLAAVDNEINSDAAVLGVLGMDTDDIVSKSDAQSKPVNVSIDDVVNNETSTTNILKTSGNSEQLIDSAYKGYYSNDKNSSLYLGSGYSSTGTDMVSKLHAAEDILPGNATSAQDAIQSMNEQK